MSDKYKGPKPKKVDFREIRPREKNKQSNLQGMIDALAKVSQLGFTIAAAVMIGVLIGRFIDNQLNSGPWFVLIFSFLGLFAAIKYIYDLSD